MKRFFAFSVIMLLGISLAFAGGRKEQGGSAQAGSTAPKTLSWKSYEGTNLNGIAFNISYIGGLQPLLPEFEKLTGMKVKLDVFNEDTAYHKIQVDLASGSSAYDVAIVHGNWTVPYAKNGWLTQLDPMIADPSVTLPDELSVKDIIPSTLDMMKYNGKLYGLPFFAATIITYYRTDILKKYGISPDQLDTIEGLAAAARKVNSPDVAGIAIRGDTVNASWISTVFLRGLGGTYVRDLKNGDYYPTFNTPAAIDSTKIYSDLLGHYSIPNAVNATYDDVVIAMQQGKAAIAIEGAPLAGRILDPDKSKVIGKIGVRMVPKGPAGRFPAFTAHGFGIPSASKHKDAAWLFLQWALSKSTQKEVALTSNHIAVTSQSLWDDPDFRKKWNLPVEGDFLSTFKDSLGLGIPDYRLRLEGWQEVNDAYGHAIQSVALGEQTAKAAMDDLQTKAVSILKRLKLIK